MIEVAVKESIVITQTTLCYLRGGALIGFLHKHKLALFLENDFACNVDSNEFIKAELGNNLSFQIINYFNPDKSGAINYVVVGVVWQREGEESQHTLTLENVEIFTLRESAEEEKFVLDFVQPKNPFCWEVKSIEFNYCGVVGVERDVGRIVRSYKESYCDAKESLFERYKLQFGSRLSLL